MKKYRMLKGVLMYLMLIGVIMANCRELLAVMEEREGRIEASQTAARLYVSIKPFEQWDEPTLEGEPIRYKLYMAWREGMILWVLRESGHYVEPESFAEFTVDRELRFEAGMALLQSKKAYIDSTPEYEE